MPTICTGSTKDRSACTCTLFIVKSSKKTKCKGCGHRQASHTDVPAHLPQEVETLPRTEAMENKYVSRLFKSLEATSVHEDARKEMLQGFRPRSPPAISVPSSKKAKGKGKMPQVSTQVPSQSKTAKLGKIVIFPCGDQNVQQFKFPTINSDSLQPYVMAGLAVEASDTGGIIFQLDWGTKQFNAFLRRQFPALFVYFDKIAPGFKTIPDEPDTVGMKRIEYSLPYVLLKKEYRKYHIVDDTHPTAIKYKETISGNTTNAGFRAKGIFLVTKAPIPQRLVDDWFKPSPAPFIPALLSKGKGKRMNSATISVSSHSSEASQDGSDYAPGDIAAIRDEATDTDDVELIEKPLKKRMRVQSLDRSGPEFVQGSSKNEQPDDSAEDQELNGLARWLDHSASFEERRGGSVWLDSEKAELEEGYSNNVWVNENPEQFRF